MDFPVNIVITTPLNNFNESMIDYYSVIMVIELPGILDMATGDQLSVLLRTIINGGTRKIIFDIKRLKAINSPGIAVLISMAKLIRNRKGDVVLLNIPENLAQIFEAVNLQRFIRIFSQQEEAVHFLRMFV